MDNFTHSVDRVLSLLALHESLTPAPGRPAEEKADLLRGAVVLSAAALDELIRALILEALPRAAQRGLLGSLAEKWIKDDPAGFLRILAASDQPRAIRDMAKTKLGEMTFQRASMIEGVLRETLRCDVPWGLAATELARDGGPSTADGVRDALDRIIDRRNRIAHDGDRRAEDDRLRSIGRSYVYDAARLILEVGLAAAAVVRARVP